MSELKFEYKCSQFEVEDTENLFGQMNLQPQEEQHVAESKENLDDDDEKTLKQQQLEQDLEQLQRRQSIVYDNAQKQVAVLENLLKTVDSDWQKEVPTGAVTQQDPAPQAYRFKDIYEHKKQQLLRQRLEQERAQRQFRSRPMPNFGQVHQQLANKQVVHHITCAVTPNVLKTSRNMLLKRRQKVEQLLQEREQERLQQQKLRPKTKPVPKFIAAPLKPANGQSSQFQLEVKPFRLSTELRAEQRKIFNSKSHLMQETRRREQAEQRKRLEHEEFKKQRQLATFRARPNPFKFQFDQVARQQ
ncbi:zinc finger protein 853 [Drosophila novamexicana]|uniref:zinc finger protein 853 n=1 Tax=Drosophila novamexicana TaxID=47314 RepID=UPI0011E5D46F|nr:zinc finger protein 853 [Drosophila novamexicana]